MAEVAKAASSAGPRRIGLALAGLAALVVGLLLLGFGLAPLKQMMDTVGPVFGGGEPPADLGERLDASMAALKGRALFTGLGFILALAGFVMLKTGLAKPQKSVEQLVNDEVDRRMAAMPPRIAVAAEPAGALPPPLPPPPTPGLVPFTAPPPASPSPSPSPSPHTATGGSPAATASTHLQATSMAVGGGRRTHCPACGSVLVAGGRLCPRGHPQA